MSLGQGYAPTHAHQIPVEARLDLVLEISRLLVHVGNKKIVLSNEKGVIG